jgi:pimeloyl-ACP methyl ester carboxylesterase
VVLDRLQQLAQQWRSLDWRAVERQLNSVPHYRTRIEDIDLHFIHKRSSRADAIPILLAHGWPGSFHEFVHLVESLTNPPQGQQAFHVVIPSMPGFTFSSAPISTRWQMNDTARIYDRLMQQLGYQHYTAQGGDWGSIAVRLLGALYPERCVAVHLNFCPVAPPGIWLVKVFPSLIDWTPFVSSAMKTQTRKAMRYLDEESGYRGEARFILSNPGEPR